MRICMPTATLSDGGRRAHRHAEALEKAWGLRGGRIVTAACEDKAAPKAAGLHRAIKNFRHSDVAVKGIARSSCSVSY
jgi:hypothetical protein